MRNFLVMVRATSRHHKSLMSVLLNHHIMLASFLGLRLRGDHHAAMVSLDGRGPSAGH